MRFIRVGGVVSVAVAWLLFVAVSSGAPEVVKPNTVTGINIDSWCSGGKSGFASCTLVRKRRGRLIVAWATNRSSVRKYQFCLRNPIGARRCVRRPVREATPGTVGDGFWLNHELRTNRPGVYGASWIANGRRVGPMLHFRIR